MSAFFCSLYHHCMHLTVPLTTEAERTTHNNFPHVFFWLSVIRINVKHTSLDCKRQKNITPSPNLRNRLHFAKLNEMTQMLFCVYMHPNYKGSVLCIYNYTNYHKLRHMRWHKMLMWICNISILRNVGNSFKGA
jgi:hypothetical protein